MNGPAPLLRWWLPIFLILGFFTTLAVGQVRYPSRIGQRQFVLDEAGVIASVDLSALQSTGAKSLDTWRAPIIVVTLKSLGDYGASGQTPAAYAQGLFNDWGIGDAGGSKGILLLVVVDDHQVRIETGRAWGHSLDGQCQQVVDSTLLPAFRRGDYTGGIRRGVDSLAVLAGGGALAAAPVAAPATPRPSLSGPPPTILMSGLGTTDVLLILFCPLTGLVGLIVWIRWIMNGYGRAQPNPRGTAAAGAGFFGYSDGGGWGGGGFSDGGGGGSCGGGDSGGGGAGGSW